MRFKNKKQAFRKRKILGMTKKSFTSNEEPWQHALSILVRLETAKHKLDYYLSDWVKEQRNYEVCRAYVMNVVKHKGLLEYFLNLYLKRSTKPLLRCYLMLVLGRLLQSYLSGDLSDKSVALLVNGWVERSKLLFSLQESKCINAILRRLWPHFKVIDALPLPIRYSAPNWFIERYKAIYGEDCLLKFLQWNEGFATVYIRTNEVVEGLQLTRWPGFYSVQEAGAWESVFALIKQGKAYIQDPMTRIPIDLLQIEENQNVLDLCSAPGGKTVQLAQKIKMPYKVVSVDLPEHTKRLHDNIRYYPNVCVVPKNVFELNETVFKELSLPQLYERVLIDVPCSNTGVIRRKPDVMQRLKESDFTYLSDLQYRLLCKASSFVQKDGLLVYSTCSIDNDENQKIIDRFIQENPNFKYEDSHVSLPWVDGHDGGGAFCLKCKA